MVLDMGKEDGTLNYGNQSRLPWESDLWKGGKLCRSLQKGASQVGGTARTKAGGMSDGLEEQQRGEDVTEATLRVRSEE